MTPSTGANGASIMVVKIAWNGNEVIGEQEYRLAHCIEVLPGQCKNLTRLYLHRLQHLPLTVR